LPFFNGRWNKWQDIVKKKTERFDQIPMILQNSEASLRKPRFRTKFSKFSDFCCVRNLRAKFVYMSEISDELTTLATKRDLALYCSGEPPTQTLPGMVAAAPDYLASQTASTYSTCSDQLGLGRWELGLRLVALVGGWPRARAPRRRGLPLGDLE
jgi:hypothetical protein